MLYPGVLGVARSRNGEAFGLLHFSAHPDAEREGDHTISDRQAIFALLDDGIVEGRNMFEVGLRGRDVTVDTLQWLQSKEVRDAMVSALIYPAILIVVAVSSIFILLGYVVPQFTELFEDVGQVLPLPTRITIAVGEGLQSYGWIAVLVIAAGGWIIRRPLQDPRGRRRWHARFLKMPLAGVIITRVEVARFARTLGTLLHNGVPVLKALSIVKDSIGNQVIADGIERLAGSLKEGQNLAEPLAEAALFPAFAIHMIRVGEESGRLEELLLQVASIYDRETQVTIKRTLSLLEPVLILVLGIVIAAVIISILMAILGINQLVF